MSVASPVNVAEAKKTAFHKSIVNGMRLGADSDKTFRRDVNDWFWGGTMGILARRNAVGQECPTYSSKRGRTRMSNLLN